MAENCNFARSRSASGTYFFEPKPKPQLISDPTENRIIRLRLNSPLLCSLARCLQYANNFVHRLHQRRRMNEQIRHANRQQHERHHE